MTPSLLVIDVGGTFIKYGVADDQGNLIPGSVQLTPSRAEESAEGFLQALSQIIAETNRHGTIQKAAVSICGPFDFANGVSLMQHKFVPLYGRALTPPFEAARLPVSFLHDSTAFMLGEYGFGSLQGAENACCVMLGTGLGFAWLQGGKVCTDENRSPALALWRAKYLDGIAEDYVSTRALQRYYGEQISVKNMADLARQGDARAREAFLTAGRHLSAIMGEVIPRLGCRRFALGGQIAKSADLFDLHLPLPWQATKHPEDAALLGACRFAFLGQKACEQKRLAGFDALTAHPV